MIRYNRRRISWPVLVVFLGVTSLPAQGETKGQRLFSIGHSFHVFMPPILADIAKTADIQGHTQVGLSSIGGSRVYQHWNVPETMVASGVEGLVLPAETIRVASTALFAKSGKIIVQTKDGETEVSYIDKTPTSFAGCSGGKGALEAGAKVINVTNHIKEPLKAGKIDVFTMSPANLPDDGIEKFVRLGVENNPKIRIFVQASWLPWDYDMVPKQPVPKVDHNAPTAETLNKVHRPYFQSMDEHVALLNKKYETNAVRVAPIGQAVIKLREKIIAGETPGLKEQNDLFSDAVGHAKPQLQALVGYCYYALIYEKSPIGLPAPAVLLKANQNPQLNELLQRIAWETVTAHPLSGVKR